MSTEIIRFGKSVFTTVDGTVSPATEKKLSSALAIEKQKAKESDKAENALRVATYLCGKSDDTSLWAFIGTNPVIELRKTTVSDPAKNDNVDEFEFVEKDVASVVLPVWFDSIAKEYSTMRAKIARFFKIATYDCTDTVSRSDCYETMYELAKMMGLTFSKAMFRAFETSVNRIKLDKFGHAEISMTNLDKAIMGAFHLSGEAIAKHDEKLVKKYL